MADLYASAGVAYTGAALRARRACSPRRTTVGRVRGRRRDYGRHHWYAYGRGYGNLIFEQTSAAQLIYGRPYNILGRRRLKLCAKPRGNLGRGRLPVAQLPHICSGLVEAMRAISIQVIDQNFVRQLFHDYSIATCLRCHLLAEVFHESSKFLFTGLLTAYFYTVLQRNFDYVNDKDRCPSRPIARR